MAIKILAISDNKPGHLSQIQSVLDVLKVKNKIYVLKNSLLGKISFPLPLGVKKSKVDEIINNLKNNIPNIILVVGRRNLSIALYLKNIIKLHNPNVKLVFLMPPGILNHKSIDFIFMHCYKMKNHVKYSNNIIPIEFSPARLTLNKDIQSYKGFLEGKSKVKPYIGVIIGGKAKGVVWNKKIANILCKAIKALQKKNNGYLFVCNSRRTGSKISMFIENNLPENSSFYRFNDPNHNPYLDIVTKSNILVVTAESTSMIADCITLNENAKVLIFNPKEFKAKRFNSFIEFLYRNNFAKSLNNGNIDLKNIEKQNKKDNTAYFVASFLNTILNKQQTLSK